MNVRFIVSAVSTKGNMLVRVRKFPEIRALLNRSDEKGILLDECVTTTFYPSKIDTVPSNEMEILVELEYPYILLQCKFQFFTTLIY